MPTTALTTKLPKKNKDQFLSHAGLSAPLQEQCDHFSKRLHQHQADIKHGDKTHVHECPFVSELLTTGERFSREPKVEEYPSLVTSTVFSSRKCIPPSTWESSRGPGICHCVKETSPNPTQREKKKYSKVLQHLKPSPQLASLWSDRFPVSWPQPLQNTKSKMLKGFFVRTQKQFC